MAGGRHGLEIRSATPADAPLIAELLAGAGRSIPVAILAARLATIRQSPATALIALEWGPPSGLIVLHWYPTLALDRLSAQITTLLVGAADRRRGIGRLLVKAAAQAARVAGCDTLEAATGEAQPELQAFLDATGFASDWVGWTRNLRKQ